MKAASVHGLRDSAASWSLPAHLAHAIETAPPAIDRRGLATLSGFGKPVANLALRLGLGQVLTNNVLPPFIGYEIDGSLDADRAESTAQTLRGLVASIAQIVLVTHKSPAGDYSVALAL